MALHPKRQLNLFVASELVSGPATEPVELAELQTHLKQTDDDTELTSLITVAREYIETMTGIVMITQTWKAYLDHWPGFRDDWWDGMREGAVGHMNSTRESSAQIILPKYPLQSVDSMNVYDTTGTQTAVTVADVFKVSTVSRPGRMALKFGQSWPIANDVLDAVEITYDAGYGNAATDVPAPLRQAVLLLAAYLYSHKGDDCTVDNAYTSSGASALVGAYATKSL